MANKRKGLYDFYYTASDVNIYLRYAPTDRQVHIDKALGIGYTHTMSSAPVYGLGVVDPLFFSRGNSLVQGSIDIAFKSPKYLQAAVNYLIKTSSTLNEQQQLLGKKNRTKDEVLRLNALQSSTQTAMTSTSISQIFNIFEIIIVFNNTNATTDGVSHEVKLEGVRFTSEGFQTHTGTEGVLSNRYTFLAKNKS